MKITRQHLKDLSDLIFNGYLTDDLFFFNTYMTVRTLTNKERDNLLDKYKHLNDVYRYNMIIDILSIVIINVGSAEIENRKLFRNKIAKLNSKVIFSFYNFYLKVEERTKNTMRFIEFFIESNESRSNWVVYKNFNANVEFEQIRKINLPRFYWIYLNVQRDDLERERKNLNYVEFIAGSICAFQNPKEYRRLRSSFDLTKSFKEIYEDIEYRREVLAQLEKHKQVDLEEVSRTSGDFINADQHVFDQLKQGTTETKEDYNKRINEMMRDFIKGKNLDEFDQIVLEDDLNIFRKWILEKRKNVEIARYLQKQRQLSKNENMNEIEMTDEERKEDEEVKKKGFYSNGVSYLDIANHKLFGLVPKELKQKIFDDLMTEKIDIERAVENYQKGGAKKQIEAPELAKELKPIEPIENKLDETRRQLNTARDKAKAAFKSNFKPSKGDSEPDKLIFK